MKEKKNREFTRGNAAAFSKRKRSKNKSTDEADLVELIVSNGEVVIVVAVHRI
jgi:hypothetical protein